MAFKDPEKRKEYHRKYMKEVWYPKNKKKHQSYIREQRKKRMQWLRKFKASLKCNRCPENHPACLEFHHKDRSKKESGISQAVRKGWGRERVLEEIKKCEVLCSNCHKKEHAKELLGY